MFGLKGRQLFILLVLIAALFAGSQYVPGYIAAYQFSDYARQEVKYAVSARRSAEAIPQDLLDKPTELGTPLHKQDCPHHAARSHLQHRDRVSLAGRYEGVPPGTRPPRQ
jgi:hypothetical protein